MAIGQRNLLLCFDAFGTLFRPKQPIPVQYAAVARQHGLDGFGLDQLAASFGAAFKQASHEHPNYGRASGMGAERWWTNVIHKTFQPLVGPGREVPKELAPRLLHRFSSREGYALADPGVHPLLRSLKQPPSHLAGGSFRRIVVGVITNSDDRVPGILSSLGFRVSPLRAGRSATTDTATVAQAGEEQYDIDLHCMSYDVGFAKPDRRIFDAAEAVANKIVTGQQTTSAANSSPLDDVPWLKVYVGDEFGRDVLGAQGAGWNAVLITGPEAEGQGHGHGEELSGLRQLDAAAVAFEDVFPPGAVPPRAIRADSVKSLLEWLIRQHEGAE